MRKPSPEALADVALIYSLVGDLNEVARRLTGMGITIGMRSHATKGDPLNQMCSVHITMDLEVHNVS